MVDELSAKVEPNEFFGNWKLHRARLLDSSAVFHTRPIRGSETGCLLFRDTHPSRRAGRSPTYLASNSFTQILIRSLI